MYSGLGATDERRAGSRGRYRSPGGAWPCKRLLAPWGGRVAALFLLILSPSMAAGAASGDMIGSLRVHRIVEDETLLQVARRHDLGYVELLAANPGVDPWIPDAGRHILLPTAHLLPQAARRGIVINLAELRLYLFGKEGEVRATFPLGIGRQGWQTPEGETRIVAKRRDPVWVPPKSIIEEQPDLPAAVPPGPNNPLGAYALNLDWPGYVIHGTNKPYGVGRRVSHGCIRLYPEDIAWLFDEVGIGTRVTIVDQPVKIGWSDGALYLEAHPTQSQVDELETLRAPTPAPAPGLMDWARLYAGEDAERVDWARAESVVRERRGVPVRITRR